MLRVFENIPDLYLILSPDLTILTASEPYLRAAGKERRHIQGKPLFDVFPDNPAARETNALADLRQSLEWVLQHRQPHPMPLQRYDVTQPGQPENFERKYWRLSNTPVLDGNGDIWYIIHRVEEMTELVTAHEQLDRQQEQHTAEEQLASSAIVAAQSVSQLEREKARNILMDAPALICLFEGPQHVFRLVNPLYQQLVGERPLLGKPIAEAMPELAGQPIFGLLDKVYRTGESFYANEMIVQLDHNNTGGLGNNYYNFVYQPTHDLQGKIDGIMVFAYEVTALVKSRQEVEQREQALQELNERLSAANEALREAYEELSETQLALRNLNQELEERVLARTRELERAKAETEIQRNHLYELFMQAPAPICILNGRDLTYQLVNPAYQQLLPGRRLLGNSMISEALAELVNQPLATMLEHVYQTGETIEGREELIPVARYEGAPLEDRYFNFTLQARRNEQGEVDGIIIFAHEVTDQVAARQAVEQSASQLQLITDALPVLIGYLDKEEKYRFANRAYESWFDTDPKNLLGRPVREVVGEKAYQGVKNYIERALAGERLDFESRMPYREDFVKYIRTSYVPDIREGKVAGFFTLVNDITEQVEIRQQIEEREREARALAGELKAANEDLSRSVKAYKRLSKQQQQLVALVENSTDFIGLATPQGRGIYINKSGLELVGLEKSQVEEVEILDFFHEEDKPFVEQMILPTLLETDRWVGEYRLRHFRTGESIPIYYNCFSIREPATGELLGLASIIIDITETKKQEAELQELTMKLAGTNEELREANAQLTRTNIDLDNFIYAASHDLKAPISNIEGLMHILFDSLPPQALAKGGLEDVRDMIEDSIERFKRTIEHLTEVTKLQKENNQDAVQVDLQEVIRDVRLDLSTQLEEAGAQLEVDVEGCPGIRLTEKNLRSVVYNLISNAVKYRSPERAPQVLIHCRTEGEFAVLSVRDNGLGMDLSRSHKLFTMFGRLHDHVEGTGIGLYMVKKILENAGGRIEVESQVGKGTTFTVYFRS